MPIAPYLLNVVQDQRKLVLAIESEEVTAEALNIAYYVAMINAAVDDPFDDPTEQDEMLNFLSDELTSHVEKYQVLVNNEL